MEWKNERAPVWDGARWHLARVKTNEHAIHEIAHWIVATNEARALPNYGLGTDPDDGPRTEPDLLAYVSDAHDREEAARTLIELYENDPRSFLRLYEAKLAREEELAAVVTVLLLRNGGMPWAAMMRKTFMKPGVDPAAMSNKFWGLVRDCAMRGVYLENPLGPYELTSKSA